MEIKAGEGGQDSKNFVDELFSAYLKYAEKNNLKCSLLESSSGHVTASISGKNVWDSFKDESGKHVCQRIPVTETKGRKQTSFVSVAVLPVKAKQGYQLKDADIEITTQRGTGAGGQHQNVHDSAVRMVHRPTKISVWANAKSQQDNRKNAFKVLTARVEKHYNDLAESKYQAKRKKQLDGGRGGDKIRTYNFLQDRVKDHRTNKKASTKQIMKGNFNLLQE